MIRLLLNMTVHVFCFMLLKRCPNCTASHSRRP